MPLKSRLLVSLLLALFSFAGALGQNAQARIKPGDVLSVIVTGAESYGGDFTVLTDGSISGKFGRVLVANKTVAEAERAIVTEIRRYIKNPLVAVTLKSQRTEVVFVSGANAAGNGAFPHTPGMSLREVLALVPLEEDADELDLNVYRDNRLIASADMAATLAGQDPAASLAIQANDLISILPKPYVRIWVTGMVAKPGEHKLPAGSGPYKAIAAAGGIVQPTLPGATTIAETDLEIFIRRGPDAIPIPARQEPGESTFRLEYGDTVVVQHVPQVRISVLGEVKTPGEILIRESAALANAIAQAGGITPDGTFRNIIVSRGTELFQVDLEPLAQGVPVPHVPLKDGDVVLVPKNGEVVTVLGDVKNPGRIAIPDGQVFRISDALAAAGGLTDRGTLRRVFLARRGTDGKMAIQQVNLDEYVKDGNLAANPIVSRGDILLFGQPKGITLANAGQFLSAALLIDSLIRR